MATPKTKKPAPRRPTVKAVQTVKAAKPVQAKPNERSPQSLDWSPYKVGQALRANRITRGLSINELAREVDLSASFLSQVETGQSDLSVGRLVRVSQVLGVSPADILNVPAPDEKPV